MAQPVDDTSMLHRMIRSRVYLVLLHVLLIALLALLYRDHVGGQNGAHSSQEWSPWYRKSLLLQRRQDALVPPAATVVIGDSLVQGLALQSLGPNVVNYGIAGDTTAGVLNRIRWYQSLTQAELAIIAIGINDLMSVEIETSLSNYDAILQALPAGLPVIFSLVLPVDESQMGLTDYTRRIALLNDRLRSLCDRHQRVRCLDVEQQLGEQGVLKADYHVGDGLHLNDAGNRVWLTAMREMADQMRTSR